MAKKRYYSDGMYAGMDARRHQEYEDSMMISEDRSAVANLPQAPIMKAYPSQVYGMNEGKLDDTIRGIDVQERDDVSNKTMKKGKYPEKY